MTRRRHLFFLSLVVAGSACATGGASARTAASGDVITREEIQRTTAKNVYDAITALRPSMLTVRGRTTLMAKDTRVPIAYLDDRQLTALTDLRDVVLVDVWEIRYMSATQAQVKWGSGHSAGAILVTTRRSPK